MQKGKNHRGRQGGTEWKTQGKGRTEKNRETGE